MNKVYYFLIKFFEFIFPFSFMKYPFGKAIFLNIIPPNLGLFEFIYRRKFLFDLWPLLLIVIMNSFQLLIKQDFGSIARIGQLVGLFGFMQFLILGFNEKKMKKLAFIVLCFSFGFILFEYIFMKPYIIYKLYFKWYLTSGHRGLIGAPNFSSVLASIMALVLFRDKKYWAILLAVGVSIMSISRGGLIPLLVFLPLWCISKLKFFPKRHLITILTGIIILTPFLFLIGPDNFTEKQLLLIEKLTSGRLFIYLSFLDIFQDFPLGIGYFNGREMIGEYIVNYANYTEKNGMLILSLEQHSIFIQVLSEFGIIGYGLFSYFLLNLVHKCSKIDFNLANLIFSSMMPFILLNGLSEVGLYFVWSLGIISVYGKSQFNLKDFDLKNWKNSVR